MVKSKKQMDYGNIKWRKIEEYKKPSYAGYDPIALLGWWYYGMAGYPPCVAWMGCGYLGLNNKWHDVSDNKAWPEQPTHFAITDCRTIPLGERQNINEN